MRRPLHSDEAGKRAEVDVAAYLTGLWHLEFWPLPRFSPVDWLASRDGSLVAAVEIKSRSTRPNTYPTLILSAHKWLSVRDAARGLHIAPILVASFTNGAILYGNLNEVTVTETRIGGRTDRGDPADTEPVVHLRIADLHTARTHTDTQCEPHMRNAMRCGNANGRTDGRTDGDRTNWPQPP